MNRKIRVISAVLLACATVCTTACSKKEEAPKGGKSAAAAVNKGALPNYRYIDSDTVLAKYNLSKDFEEEMMRMQNNYESEARKHESQVRNLQSSMQNKMQNNQYASEAAFKQDQQRLAQMSSNAEQTLGGMQQNMASSAEHAQKVLNDSIQNFIKEYNLSHGYDAIFYKGAAVYIDPRLDITDEVVEGLNARYNKVKK